MFDDFRGRFEAITRRARSRFERRDWHRALADAGERLDLYARVIDSIEQDIRQTLASRVTNRALWAGIKAVYSGLIEGREDLELAETFFNSVTRRIFATVGVDPNIEFVDSDFEPLAASSFASVLHTYAGTPDPVGLVRDVLNGAGLDARFVDAGRDARLVADRLAGRLRSLGSPDGRVDRAEIVRAPFFRRKGAYLIGRVFGGPAVIPVALALLHTDEGIRVDAVLTEENDLSILFSFTRSHFHVDAGPPHALVGLLKELMPRKRVAELYIAVGHHKHGKTELYRDLLGHLRTTEECFERAPGTPGLVMVVFTMPGYDLVFKVIRDRFPAGKAVTRQGVMRNYRLVFGHDRAGRLVEAQEFEHLKFDRGRFAPDLAEELQQQAGRSVEVVDDALVIHHAYVERRVTPLDLHIARASDEEARRAVVDFGQALKDLAATNIFPGDLLPKNFGLTRHGRVVCYDYDELGLLTDFLFRRMPEAHSYDEEIGDEAWFGVGPQDAFPEEFAQFVGLPPALHEIFGRIHGELYDLGFWQEMQASVRRGDLVDIFPYHSSRRLDAGRRT